ncbi:hypothetical protein [Arenibacterium sp. LLYu02]|uniref:hypothetical protein n=1 Tax=Arenibacterium sp. LLYu02 TaxID=3404132 RepID=UPI003B210DBB
MRPEVSKLLLLGCLPSEEASLSEVKPFEIALEQISPPLTNEEAEALLCCFGVDDSFGLAWQLVHLIETSPDAYPDSEPEEGDNYWLKVLYARYVNSQG